MAVVSWKEELALIVLAMVVGVAGALTYCGTISSDNFTMIAVTALGILAGVLGVKEMARRNSNVG